MSAFSITVAGQADTTGRSRRYDAIARSRELAVKHNTDVKVTDADGQLVFSCNPTSLAGSLFGPYERIQTDIGFPVNDVEGYVPGYVRKTAQAVVFRPLVKGEPWLIVSPGLTQF
jgi:hypothetical protein